MWGAGPSSSWSPAWASLSFGHGLSLSPRLVHMAEGPLSGAYAHLPWVWGSRGSVGLQWLCSGRGMAESRCGPVAPDTDWGLRGAGPPPLPHHCLAALSVLPLVCVLWCPLPVPLWEGATALGHVWGLAAGGSWICHQPSGCVPHCGPWSFNRTWILAGLQRCFLDRGLRCEMQCSTRSHLS